MPRRVRQSYSLPVSLGLESACPDRFNRKPAKCTARAELDESKYLDGLVSRHTVGSITLRRPDASSRLRRHASPQASFSVAMAVSIIADTTSSATRPEAPFPSWWQSFFAAACKAVQGASLRAADRSRPVTLDAGDCCVSLIRERRRAAKEK